MKDDVKQSELENLKEESDSIKLDDLDKLNEDFQNGNYETFEVTSAKYPYLLIDTRKGIPFWLKNTFANQEKGITVAIWDSKDRHIPFGKMTLRQARSHAHLIVYLVQSENSSIKLDDNFFLKSLFAQET